MVITFGYHHGKFMNFHFVNLYSKFIDIIMRIYWTVINEGRI